MNKFSFLVALVIWHTQLNQDTQNFVCACNIFNDFCDDLDEDPDDIGTENQWSNKAPINISVLIPPHEKVPEKPPERNPSPISIQRKGKMMSSQVTTILDKLLFESGYDRQIRPQIHGDPVQVEVNIAIRSMGPVDEMSQTIQLDCYFRQFWKDSRLKFNGTKLSELPMNWQFLTKIWRPDTVIINGKDSNLHKITVPNRFIRISPQGRISYSQRLTVKARCQMDLRKFPLDRQTCPLLIGSFGYDAGDIIYKFSRKPLSWVDKEKLGLAQYYMVHWSHGKSIGTTRRTGNPQNMSTVFFEFSFQRRTGFFLLQIYIPLTLMVFCSWVTFWLAKTEKGGEIPARTSLGATTVLTVVTIGFGGKSKPQVGYATALDVFIILCFFIVFAALVEFACLNFLDTLVRRMKKRELERKKYQEMIFSSLGGLRSTAVHGSNFPGGKTIVTNDEMRGLLDENLLSPIHSSELNSPTTGGPSQTWLEVARKHHKQKFKEAAVSNKSAIQAEDNKWETIETQVVYDNGSKETILAADNAMNNFNVDDDTCREKCWECLEETILKLFCCNFSKSFRSAEVYKNMGDFFNKVDHIASRVFPLTFMVINIAYWTLYMYIL